MQRAGPISQELYFIISGTLTLTLSFDPEGNARLPQPGHPRTAGTVDRIFTYGPGTASATCCTAIFSLSFSSSLF